MTKPANRRIAPKPIVEAPADPLPIGDDESPAPSAVTSVRPPKRSSDPAINTKAPKPKGKLRRGVELTLGAIVVVAASIAVAWGARRYVMTSPRFAVKTIAVDGTRRRTAQDVARFGSLEVGKNIFQIDLIAAGTAIAEDPWIERATVTRKLPGTIQVTVVEREAAAMASIGGELYLATRDGDLFKKVVSEDPSDLPVITGILPDLVAHDRAGAVIQVKRSLDVAEDIERAGIARRYPIQEIHIEKDGSLVVTIGKEGIALYLGQAPYKAKIAEGARVLNEVGKRRANASVIFLDNDAHPERVVVRMR